LKKQSFKRSIKDSRREHKLTDQKSCAICSAFLYPEIKKTVLNKVSIEVKDEYSIGCFTAMACPCEILIETQDEKLALKITEIAYQEAKRIENKFSRYSSTNIIYKINNSNGNDITVDDETALMLNFSQQCYELSNGKFDITSGILRKAWQFDGSDNIPTNELIQSILPNIGWEKVSWIPPTLQLPQGMEIDLGGIGKEYAVDSSVKLIKNITDISFLVNFGGDIASPFPRKNNVPWYIGIDNPEQTGESHVGEIHFYQGGLATSGDARRYLLKDGARYGHILDPHSGYPVIHAPRSITVIASSCVEAGMLSTFAMLEGSNASNFLREQNVKYWCIP